ncbi:MAG: hypothetical protein PHP52_06975 [Bacteroidales bacterium]|nr:hypothetical protein [Bacteroidales bacterium]MDD4217090.1 hypothetical protein [Bacteroidales bacterium]MDY0142143.1 hypothetical protein [Bacteroidales bacterium]
MTKKIKLIKTYKILKTSPEDKNLQEIQEYNITGNLIYNKEFDETGSAVFEVSAQFDETGKPINEKSMNYLDDIEEIISYKYNDKGKLISEKTENKQGWTSIKKYERQNDGKTVKVSLLDEDDELEEMNIVELNEKGDIVYNKHFDENEKQKEVVKNSYDDSGKLILREELDHKNRPEKVHHYYYTDAGNISAVKTLNRKGKTIDWVKIEFDENEKPVEQFAMSGAKIKFIYNDDGSITELKLGPGGEELSRVTNYFDEDKNLVKEDYGDYIIVYEHEFF